jgi:hypothetical protein
MRSTRSVAGRSWSLESWIPAEDLAGLSENIAGLIDVVAEYRRDFRYFQAGAVLAANSTKVTGAVPVTSRTKASAPAALGPQDCLWAGSRRGRNMSGAQEVLRVCLF